MTTDSSALSLSALALTGELSEMLSVLLLLLTHAYVYNAHFYEGAPCDQMAFSKRTKIKQMCWGLPQPTSPLT